MIILGIDQAAVSGWAVHAGGRIVAHGVAKTWEDRERVLALIHGYTLPLLSDLLVVFEDHAAISLRAGQQRGAPTRNTAVILGMGAARGRWEEALDRIEHRERQRIAVAPRDWRGRVLGLSPSASTDTCKAEALRWASAHLFETLTDHNEAEAVCIACWGAIDGKAVWEARRALKRVVERGKRQAKKQKAFDFGGEHG